MNAFTIKGVEDKALEALVKLIVMSHKPISLTTCEHFASFVKSIAPKYKLPSRDTIVNTIEKKAVDIKQKLRRILCEKTVALTSDCWTSGMCYMLYTLINY